MKQLLSALLALCLIGCSTTTERGTYASSQQIEALKPGETTFAEVEALLGPPISRALDTTGKSTATWHYVKVTGGAFQKMEHSQQMISMVFTEANILEKHIVSEQ